MSPNILAAKFRATYPTFIHFSRKMIKPKNVLRLHERSAFDALVLKTLGTIHSIDSGLYIITEKEVFLILPNFQKVRKPTTCRFLNACTLCLHTKPICSELHVRHMEPTKRCSQNLVRFSNNDSTDGEHHLHNNIHVNYHKAFFQTQCRRQIEEWIGKG